MRNSSLYVGVIVLGVIVIVIGVLSVANIAIGYHPTRGYVLLGVGVILLIAGIVGLVAMRSRGPV
jgi:uncharacterized membrane protein HdeD (DUF308 family)